MSTPINVSPTRRRAMRIVGGAFLSGGAAVALGDPAAAAAGDEPDGRRRPRRRKTRRQRARERARRERERRRRRRLRARRRKQPVTTPPAVRPPVPSGMLAPDARHLVNRFSYGITPALAAEVHAAGGHLAWFDRQLATAYDPAAANLADWWPDLHLDPVTLWQRNTSRTRGGWEVMWDYGRRVMARRMTSPRQVLEVMQEFWENHLHVPTGADNVFTVRTAYGELVRRHALGRFDDLLQATILHPAMLVYLNAAGSTKTHPNENLGRELLELHTVGVGAFTEADVKDSARILTGWRVRTFSTWEGHYSSTDHWTGPVRVMGFSDPNAAADGRDVTRRYLSYLAHHPATARRIATRLVTAFVSDTPQPALVEQLAEVYLANDTAITPVLRALVRSSAFAAAVDQKVRDADEDVLATYRLLGVVLKRPTKVESAANAIYWQTSALGLAPLNWPQPDGQPIDNQAWSSPTRALASLSMHWDMAGGWWPTVDVTHPARTSFLPQPEMAFADLVEHLSRRLLHRPATPLLLEAACAATDYEPDEVVTARDDIFSWRWPRLVTVFLDSPAFYLR